MQISVVMLTAETVLTTQLALRPSLRATRILGSLGAAMSCGYLVEQEFRDALSPGGWDRLITPVAAAGLPPFRINGGLWVSGNASP